MHSIGADQAQVPAAKRAQRCAPCCAAQPWRHQARRAAAAVQPAAGMRVLVADARTPAHPPTWQSR